MSKYRANATDIWKRPLDIRYIWYVEADGKVYTGATWNSFDNALKRGLIDTVKICDMKDMKIFKLENSGDIDQFQHLWRENYYDPTWKFK